ncbi:MAG: hypothetical protein HDR52_08675 [Treponema sp.]|nr:hypothetical protein [Treponema sp.]
MSAEFPFAISQDDINWARQTSIDIWERDQLTNKSYMEELTRELAEKRAELEKNHAALAESHAVIEEKDAALAEKDVQLLAQMREIELLRAELANKKVTGEL